MSRTQEGTRRARKLPAGTKHLYGNLYIIPFASIKTPDPDESGGRAYVFKNPRMNTERGQADLLDKKLSEELRQSIKKNTLLNPLVCRWVKQGDESVPMVIGGDRRYRCLEYLIRKKEEVADPRALANEDGFCNFSTAPADKAYEFVACQVFAVNDDLEALALSWAENKSRINLTDGHEVAEVIKLRDSDATDAQIMSVLQRDGRWLASTDRLIASLDAMTLADLMEGRLDRDSAERLATIDDLSVRSQVRDLATESAEHAHRRRLSSINNRIVQAIEREELAEGQRALTEDDDERLEAEQEADSARAEVEAARRERDRSRPVINSRNVREAQARVEGRRSNKRLSEECIREGKAYLADIIRRNGRCPDGTFQAHVDALKLAMRILEENILDNESDFSATLRRHYSA